MIRAFAKSVLIMQILCGPVLAAEPFCYHSGRLCDCKTHICEGQDGYDKLSSDFAKPCRASKATFGCRTVRK